MDLRTEQIRKQNDVSPPAARKKSSKQTDILKNSIKSCGFLVVATLLSLLFYRLGFTEANIIMVYILGVLLTSIATSHQIYSLISSIASVFIFNYLFTPPRFTLNAYGTGYPVTFVVMFLTAYITGTFAMRYKAQAAESAKNAQRTKILFDSGQLLSRAKNREDIFRSSAEQIRKLLERDLVVYEVAEEQLCAPRFFPMDSTEGATYDLEKERPAAEHTLNMSDPAPNSTYLYLPVRVNERIYGVIGVNCEENSLSLSEHSMLLSILSETALALENERNSREKEAAAVLAESEQLRANLLRTISHDLRTPLTTISGNASNLISNGSSFDEETKQQIYSDIYNDALWLTDLVENLLYATRIEEGRMTLRTAPELLSEIIEEALEHLRRKAKWHPLSVSCEDELLLVKADARLVVQVITNIVDNAIKYTPPGTSISIAFCRQGDKAVVSIADCGDGIPEEEREKVFDKFYRGSQKIADNRRSLGLGLYLCKAIIEAHGGSIWVSDNEPRGAVFYFTLPAEEVIQYE